MLALCACGLIDPDTPPARVVDGVDPEVPGAPVPTRGPKDEPIAAPFPGYALAWHDEFNGAALDASWWNIDEGPHRDGVNSRESVSVSGGVLSFVTFTDPSGVHHAARIHTTGKYEPRYGFYEARARPFGNLGQWCAFWLWPKTMGNPLGDPGRAGVEIDIFEHRHANPEGHDLRDMIQVGLNWDMVGGNWRSDNLMVAHPDGAPLGHAWHTYAALWTEAGTTFYIDDVPIWRTSTAVSNTTQAIYFSCEVENSWAGYIPTGGYGPRELSTTGMDVDWVRVWQLAR